MNDILGNSVLFGVAVSILAYYIGYLLKKKWNYSFVNPILIATILVIAFLLIFQIDYKVYDNGAKYITFFITPATVCLAVPLYKQYELLKKNLAAVVISILCGCVAHFLTILIIFLVSGTDTELMLSLFSKSVTTPIAIGITGEIGGIPSITVLGLTVAGLMGAVAGPIVVRVLGVKEPIAEGLAIGSASHAVGTSRALELGEIQAAMSSLAIVVTGIITVVIVPVALKVFQMLKIISQ